MPSKIRYGLFISITVIGLFFTSVLTSYAETVNYVYDELNRLIRVEYEDGTVILYIYDQAGNRTEIAIPFPDTTPPTTTADPPGGAYNTTKIVTLSCSDGYGAGCDKIYYTTDGNDPTTSSSVYSSPINIPVSTTLKFFAKDLAGNSETVKTQAYTIETTAPTTTASPGGGFYSIAQAVTLTCNDGSGSGCDKIYYTTDGTTPTSSSSVYSSPINISETAALKFFAKDLAGNTETIKTETYYIGSEAISTPSNPNGPVNGNGGTSYTYSTGGAASNYGHAVEYLFDWGDGTNSGWLPVDQTSASHSWSSQGSYLVKAQARCSIHLPVVSNWSGTTSVSIVLPTGNDSYVKSLLHMNGPDGSTTFTDDAVGGTHTWTARGTAQIDTGQSKFGGASGLLDGNSDWIDTPTSTDFAFGTGDFTIDFWIKFASTASQQGILGSYVDGNNVFQIWFFGNTVGYVYKWSFYWKDGGTVRAYYITTNEQSDPGTANWHHIAWVRNGANAYFFIDGTSIALTENTAWGTLTNINSVYQVGAAKNVAGAQVYTNGWMDEVRISKGIARWTANFTPPTGEY